MLVVMMSFSICVGACGGKNKQQKKDEEAPKTVEVERRTEYVRDGDKLLRKSDSNGDGKPDVYKHFVRYPDPDNPAVTKRRLVEMEIDVDFDGEIDVVRKYSESGNLKTERVDVDLDGDIDVIRYYDGGSLSHKEILDETGKVLATRHYTNGTLLRVERDTDGNGRVDYWEYYEQGALDRVGRDYNDDGAADSWQRR
jgi:antitoxin component YwqK of YwqJK toxin-antitoxin module